MEVPSPLEPVPGAAQPKPNVRKTLDTTAGIHASRVRERDQAVPSKQLSAQLDALKFTVTDTARNSASAAQTFPLANKAPLKSGA